MKNGNIRAPDVSFVRRDRVPEGAEAQKFFNGAPDLAVEIVSPTEDREDAFRKIGEYFEAGARQVWIVQPATRTVTVYHSMDRVRTYEANEELEGGDLLPGFRCAVSDLFVNL
jgi:Uma2 family endonuclease